jgi:hypothetical protein
MSNSLFDLLNAAKVPATPEEWTKLDYQAQYAFTPHASASEEQLFAGRFALIKRMIDVVFQDGQHAIIFGDRGVGKTSFANIIKNKVFSRTESVKTIKRSCTAVHDYKLIWQHVFDDFSCENEPAAQWLETHHNPCATPPFKPPFRPRATAAGSLPSSSGVGARSSTWPVRMSPISLPSSTGSRGRLRRLVIWSAMLRHASSSPCLLLRRPHVE